MTFDWWTLGLQTINVVILIWLLSRFLFRPVARIVAERQQQAEQLLDEATAARTAAEQERLQAEADREALLAQRETALKALQHEIAETRARLLAEVQHTAERQRAEAELALSEQRQRLQLQLERQAGELALDIAAHLLTRLPDSLRHTAFLDGLIEGLAQLAPTARQTLCLECDSLILRSAQPLSAADVQHCQAALAPALGKAPQLRLEVEPGLIAGLELEGSSVVMRNSLRADLARVQRELSQHDLANT